MRNRSAIWVFTILLTLACLYQLSLSWVTGGVEDKATFQANQMVEEIKNSDKDTIVFGRDTIIKAETGLTAKQESDIKSYYEAAYLSEHADDPVYPILGLSYKKCKNQQLTKGLDLQGGMSVTLEISIPDLVKNKAGFTADKPEFVETYEEALDRFGKGDDDDFIELFFDVYENGPYKDKQMTFFAIGSDQEFELDWTHEQTKAKLQEMAESSIEATKTVIEERVNRFGLGQIVIQPEPLSGRLHIEIPGAKDKDGIRKMLQSQALLEFWNGYDADLGAAFQEIDAKFAGASSVNEVASIDIQAKEDNAPKKAVDYVVDSLKPFLAEGYTPETAVDSAMVSKALMIADSMMQMEAAEAEVAAAVDSSAVNLDAQAGNMFGGRFTFTQGYVPYNNQISSWTPQVGYVSKPSDTTFINLMLKSTIAQTFLPADVRFMWSYKPEKQGESSDKFYALYAAKVEASDDDQYNITGADVESASYTTNPDGKGMIVNLGFHNDNGAETKWTNWTSSHVGKYVGITLDNVVYSFPVINGPISGGSTTISGNFTFEEAEQLAAILEAGSLPTSPRIADESIVGATLSEENISKGIWSFVIALALVLVYMVFYYSKAGIVADIALVANMFFIFGTLASLGAALTLPGIAGLVLTIGMSVDANVLIFERIREELRAGKVIKQAIADGYKNAYSAILDSNITSLLTAIILAYFGSGPIQGFATTLIIGIFASLFCSIFVTRLLFSHMLDRKMNITFSNSFSEKVFANAKFNFMGGRRKYYFISAAIVIAGLVSLFTIGLDRSVEFTGGRNYTYSFSQAPNQDDVKNTIAKYSVEEEGKKGIVPVVKTVNGATQLNISTNFLYGSKLDDKDATAKVDSVMNLAFVELGYVSSESDEFINNPELAHYTLESQRSVSAIISNELMYKSFFAIALSLIVVFLYIGFRFNRWQFGLGALIAMFHDVMVVLGIFSLLFAFNVPLNIEIDQAFIAAILTVIGYSINDTVVIFDRIREYIGLHKRDDQDKVINGALNTTLSRTINTSLTTFIVLLIIFIFGGDGIAGFSLALLIGVAVGTYSSIFIAAPSVVEFTKNLMPVNKDKK